MSNYQADNIKSLDYFEHIRKYPGMYIGSKDAKGLLHCVKEIVSNSIDEYLNGAGNQVIITFMPNNGIRIEDNGRGIPHGKHSSGCSVLQACFGIANTGGKFDNATGASGYNTSGGEHGTGGKAVNALSTKMIVKTRREGIEEVVEFSKGQFVSHKENKIDKSITGTSVEFYPDAEVLEVVTFDEKAIKNMVREFSFLCKGLKFIINKDDHVEEFLSERGLADYMDYLNPKRDYLIDPFYFSNADGKFQLEVAVGYNSSYISTVKLYTNNIPQEKGTHLTGFKAAWTAGLNAFAKENKWLKESDENLAGSDYEEGMVLILNFKMIDPVFKGQNKEELSSSEGRTYVQRLTSQAMKDLFLSNKKDIKFIIDKAINARKAREAAKKAKDAARNTSAQGRSKLLSLPTKLVDSWSKKRSECELLISEGDSAAGGLIGARDGEFQAVFPIRGKTLNLYKSTSEKAFANQEVVNIIKALGLELDQKTKKLIYDKSKLRYGKVILCADADPDGQAIKNLLLTCFWSLCPELVINGHIYAAIPPLFRITTKKNEYIYLRDANALEEYKQTHAGEKYAVNRNKGLGEQDPAELAECLLNHKTRNVAQITVEDVEKANNLFEVFMGPNASLRKDWIMQHSEEANIE